MEIKALDFFLGLSLGAALGLILTLAAIKVRGWLGYSEAGRLKAENRSLKRRLAEKDRHIGACSAKPSDWRRSWDRGRSTPK